MFTYFQLFPSKKVYEQKYYFFKCWLKANKEILQVLEHQKTQLQLIFNENVKPFVFSFLTSEWLLTSPPPPPPLFMSEYVRLVLDPPYPTAVLCHM